MLSNNNDDSNNKRKRADDGAAANGSAFDVLMAAQAKRQRLVKSGYRHSTDDAFAEMMAAAKVPGAFVNPELKVPVAVEDALFDHKGQIYKNTTIYDMETDPKIKEVLNKLDAESATWELRIRKEKNSEGNKHNAMYEFHEEDQVEPEKPENTLSGPSTFDPSRGISSRIPSLVALAHKAIRRDLAEKAKKTEDRCEKRIRTDLDRWDFIWEVSDFIEKKETELRRSTEATRVRYLREELARAEDALVGKGQRMIKAIQDKAGEQLILKRKWCEGIQEDRYHERMYHYEEELEPYKGVLERIGLLEENAQVCTVLRCHAFFSWPKVPECQRCSVAGCSARRPSCGCNIGTCSDCDEAFCAMHMETHKVDCCGGIFAE